jgi:hypothetical protein
VETKIWREYIFEDLPHKNVFLSDFLFLNFWEWLGAKHPLASSHKIFFID